MIKASYIETVLLMLGVFFLNFANYRTASTLFLALIALLITHLLYKGEKQHD
ncbi:hypothetical protein GTO87_01855 [Ligilactobacillus saerimneri]|uniref:Uncharacterized protein n=1 Tax=Ligilactobacillus saerimneri TaxID=228229 RepID=A0A7H9EJQ1_9LACO|nr:hypothetical protein [Ligilactobacillus saerimneri]QLL77472.1 hypothetical protein GTO87_01855 [Ligilactobacillus saerimneri]